MTKLVLASASPRRSELLRGLGLEFTVVPADVDETVQPGETAQQLVARLSASKAAVVASAHPRALVIAADTTVVVDGMVINKPADEEENRAFIARLAGREHEVYTGHALRLGDRSESSVVRTVVSFRQLAPDEIARYAATGEGADKAGGYAIQGRGAALVAGIDGCYSNVVGLSLPTVVTAAARMGVTLV
ncbi:MAG TPA: Maf family protein [Trueperaceae bacterium]|nr:Maf family protein [Trueperaceae bacterium]